MAKLEEGTGNESQEAAPTRQASSAVVVKDIRGKATVLGSRTAIEAEAVGASAAWRVD